MRTIWLLGLILLGCTVAQAQDSFQLAPPVLRYHSVFFARSLPVTMEFAMAGTHIHYTLNGQEPTDQDPLYTRPVVLKKKLSVLKARVFGAGYRASEVVGAQFLRQGLTIAKLSHSPPNPTYRGSGPNTLIDGQGGMPALESKTWLGFQDTVLLSLTLAKPQKVGQVLLQVLQNQGAWIFMPQQVVVYAAEKGSEQLVLVGTKLSEMNEDDQNGCRFIQIDLDRKLKTRQVIVKVYPLAQLPAGHPGAGKPAWLFLDEINLY